MKAQVPDLDCHMNFLAGVVVYDLLVLGREILLYFFLTILI